METYRRNKLRTALEFRRDIRNWPAAWHMKLRPRPGALALLEFRSGLQVVLRVGTGDEAVLHELFFAGAYEAFLKDLARAESPLVLDLGGNLGFFALLATQAHPEARVTTFEPGPDNLRMLRMNLLANPEPASRIQCEEAAVGGRDGEASWHFDAGNPGGSGLHAGGAAVSDTGGTQVRLKSFQGLLESLPEGQRVWVKMDIEGSEFDALDGLPKACWERIAGMAIELHEDPSGRRTRQDLLKVPLGQGFRFEEDSPISGYLRRGS